VTDRFRTPRNTARAMQDPAEQMLALGASWGRGPSEFIGEQEAAGQREIVHSDVIPSRLNYCTEDDLTALGFKLGDAVDGDPMFRHATLPEGWEREGSAHAMWSHLLDELGRKRASIFYKAAFYDRDAFISVTTVSGYVSSQAYDKQPVVLDDTWATKEAVLAAIDELRTRDAERVEEWTQYGNDEYVREYSAKVREWDAFKARIEASDG
jgi:hypothetical protein